MFREPDTEIEKVIVVATLPGALPTWSFLCWAVDPAPHWPESVIPGQQFRSILTQSLRSKSKQPSCHLAIPKFWHWRKSYTVGVRQSTIPPLGWWSWRYQFRYKHRLTPSPDRVEKRWLTAIISRIKGLSKCRHGQRNRKEKKFWVIVVGRICLLSFVTLHAITPFVFVYSLSCFAAKKMFICLKTAYSNFTAPPCSHRLEPLDVLVCVFWPFKDALKASFNAWLSKNPANTFQFTKLRD